MITFIVRRILISIPLLWAVLTLTFFGFRYFVPGDPVDIMLFGRATAADKTRLRHELGYDQPILTQYWNFIRNAVHLDFGNSVYSHDTVFHEIAIRFPTTLKLARGRFAARDHLRLRRRDRKRDLQSQPGWYRHYHLRRPRVSRFPDLSSARLPVSSSASSSISCRWREKGGCSTGSFPARASRLGLPRR